jgi:hypothetical protein
MVSRIDRISSSVFPFGSSIFQSSTLDRNLAGQKLEASHPIVIIFSASAIILVEIGFGLKPLASIPISLRACTTSGFTSFAGFVPALIARKPSGFSLLKIASAIWLLPEFPTHTKRMARVKNVDDLRRVLEWVLCSLLVLCQLLRGGPVLDGSPDRMSHRFVVIDVDSLSIHSRRMNKYVRDDHNVTQR